MKLPALVLLRAYAAGLICFLAMDACWLTVMGSRLYSPALGTLMAPRVNVLAAALFYLGYVAGLVHFAVLPALVATRPSLGLRRGALLGLMAYATYDLTNQATLRGWPWIITLADLGWGTVITGISAFVAAGITCRPGHRKNLP